MYFLVLAAATGVAVPSLPALSLFDDGGQALWHDYARALVRERERAWDEIDARRIAEDRRAELVVAVNALASEREASAVRAQRFATLEAEDAQAQSALAAHMQSQAGAADELARERSMHSDTRQRLAYRESLRGWLRYPLAAARRRATKAP
jgi:hypothetical protein